MPFNYSAERNVQMLLSLMKAFKIKKVIVSPGATNVPFVASMQQDPFFEMYSCVDERSAAYMAVGMADECGEPIVLSCTGATAARNYMPALTEAFYRKLPVIAVTSTQDETRIGHLIAQVTDRTVQPRDLVVESVHIQNIRSQNDEWDCNIKLNRALQAFRMTPGPVHVNLATGMGGGYSVRHLPETKAIWRYLPNEKLPELKINGHIAIFVGSHPVFSTEETLLVDKFCATYDAVVFCDHTSSYKGRYRVMHSLIGAQDKCEYEVSKIDLLIHIGEVSGDYDTLRYLRVNRVWRVNPDGKFRDTFKGHLTAVFAIEETDFFSAYIPAENVTAKKDYLVSCQLIHDRLTQKLDKIPFSNIYMAKRLSEKLPEHSVLYLGILNTLRSWNYFDVPASVRTVSNVGGFGIDGIMSSLIGASLYDPDKLYFGILGDLSFFYDMNSLGNRHVSNNLRIMIINNGHGQEFEMYNHAASFMGDEVNTYVAAEGHYGHKSPTLIKHYVEDLGFEYIKANGRNEFENIYPYFVDPRQLKHPVIFEVFTSKENENKALKFSRSLEIDTANTVRRKVKNAIRSILH